MAEMRLARENAREIELVGHNAVGGVVAVVFGIGVVLLAGRGQGTAALVAQGLGAFFTAAGIAAALYRNRLRLDFRERVWVRRRGLVPFVRETRGSLSDVEAVDVVEQSGYHRGRPTVEWEVWIRSARPELGVRVLDTSDREAADGMRKRIVTRLA